ncbi:ribokinase [Mesorhizobium sp. BR1-1-16]|uniref:ribokinase n=1 Tax=Mesorhizobium sp. BR1-1-16 TaxID=2876653 RepID=UPI001CCE1B44|nr:ribokinase [Mesorhizobium sp. BR1-1-16]MBZ9938810.1 ribokinase [Mesorhizobium sp. BR1-1-16]
MYRGDPGIGGQCTTPIITCVRPKILLMTFFSLLDILDIAFSSRCHLMLLVLGNATVDEAMKVEVWPAPGQTIIAGAPQRDLGGKGANQAIVAARAGADVRFVAAIGDDADGRWVADALSAEGLDVDDLLTVATATDRSMIFIDPAGENAIVSTVDASRSIKATTAEALVASLRPGDQMLMQGNLSLDATRAGFAAAHRAGISSLFNPSPLHAGHAQLLPMVDMLVVNEGEARSLSQETSAETSAQALRNAGVGSVIVTLGGRGALLCDASGLHHVSANAVEVVDTTGAGDTFMGVLAAALFAHRLDAIDALEAAGRAAAITVQRAGTLSSFPSRSEIEAILKTVAPA